MSGLSKEQLEKFEKEGILVIENFLEQEEVTAIRLVKLFEIFKILSSPLFFFSRNEIHKIVENMNPETDRGVFSTTTVDQVLC